MKKKIIPILIISVLLTAIVMTIVEDAKGARMAANAITDIVQQEVCTNQALSKVTITYTYNDGTKLITDHYCIR